ncbi:MAG: 4-(cytidine 5'-diphospho)-2-C-methyl-D-erythritol kinase [Calditrichaeota bacterium]|nr:4-(cytidine 5'-diphospho)-2-C-methyl-D-erythritol kinase [Calditrichota bacterium]
MSPLIARACAKINIGLRILGKRPNGYHEIETIFQSVDLCDEVSVSEAESAIFVESDQPGVPRGEANICYRAAELLRKKAGVSAGCRIRIAKKIPMGAGLGGGSTDAAAALRLLNRVWGLNLSNHDLAILARELGADVPFFLNPGAAIAYGIGDELQPLPKSWDFYGVILYPNRSVSTEWAYKNLKINLTKAKKYIKLSSYFVEQLFLQELPLFFRNDFEPLIFETYPEFREIKRRLLQAGSSFASLSGSGSAFFGLFDQEKMAQEALTLFDSHPYQKFFVRPYRELL